MTADGMWELKANYGRKGLDNRYTIYQSEQDTIEHVLECHKVDVKFNLNDGIEKEWDV